MCCPFVSFPPFMQMSYQYRRVNDQLVPEALIELGFEKEIGPIDLVNLI